LPLDSAAVTTAEQSAPVIVFEEVAVSFAENDVLRGISFRLNRGETKAVFGVAGSGKSLILKLALGLIRPDAGRIIVLGQDVTQMREEDLFQLRGKIGMVFQESALFDSLTVRENVAYQLTEEHGIYDEDIDRRVREALRFVELEHTLDLDPAVVFPTEHMVRAIAAGLAGKNVLSFPVFDGSETGDKVFNTLTVVGHKVAPNARPHDDAAANEPKLANVARWPVTISYFSSDKAPESGEITPDYAIGFELYQNGISRALSLDYNDFVVTGKLTSLEFKPVKPCH